MSGEALQIAVKRREAKSKGEKERYKHLNAEFQRTAKRRWEADCGSDYELLIAKFRLKLKKVGKTTRPFRYDLNQIPYDYTVEVRNGFKGLDLIDKCLMNYGRRLQETGIKIIPKKKKCKKAKQLLRRPYK